MNGNSRFFLYISLLRRHPVSRHFPPPFLLRRHELKRRVTKTPLDLDYLDRADQDDNAGPSVRVKTGMGCVREACRDTPWGVSRVNVTSVVSENTACGQGLQGLLRRPIVQDQLLSRLSGRSDGASFLYSVRCTKV